MTICYLIPAGLFESLPSLENVDLSDNMLTDIPAGLFKSTSSLKNVNLSDNLLPHIPAGLFESLTSLENVDLSDNMLTDIPAGLFKSTSSLKNVNLSDNSLADIPAGLFESLTSLQNVDLSDNYLTHTTEGLFQSLPSLKYVNLSDNLLTDIPAGLFHSLPSLKDVDLSDNSLAVIHSRTFVNLPKLEIINLAENNLYDMVADAISPELPSVININLKKNQLTAIPTFIFLLCRLEITDLSSNRVTIESIKESLEKITSEQLKKKKCKKYEGLDNKPVSSTRLIFGGHNISTIHIESLNNSSVSLETFFFDYFRVLLDDNYFVCVCRVYSFYNHTHTKEKQKTTWEAHDFNKKNLKCEKTDPLHGKLLYNFDPSDFVCMENFPLCPENCTCFRRAMDEAVTVHCKQVNMSDLPTQLPEGSTELDLSDNLITKFDSAYPYLVKLEKLNLQNNIIDSISADVLDLLDGSHMKKLQLDSNRLHVLPQKADVWRSTNLSHLTLGKNPWECNCHTSWMRDWLIERKDIIQDLNEVMCDTGIAAGLLYVEFKEEHFNCITPAVIVVRNALLSVGAVLVLCVIAVILICVYRGEIKILLYIHCNWHPFDAAENADILDMTYDVFISYSSLDYKWVCFDLLPKLENHNPPYRVCVHDRDFMPGAYIEDNIMEAVQSSRRMILVLSQNYLKSEWCMLEFRAAHNKVLNERTNYLILVLYDDVNVSELDEDMQLYIRTNTYLARSNQWFYNKLLYSMPTQNLLELRKEMETKTGRTPSNHSLDFTYNDEQESSSSQLSSNVETLMTTIV